MPEPPHQSARTEGPDRGSSQDARVGIAAPGGLSGLYRFSHEAMATIFEVFTPHPDRRYAAQAAQAAFDLADRIERDLSRFIPNSDIARVNALRAGQQARVGPATMECLALARHVFDLTAGAFDISLGTGLPALELHEDGVRATGDSVQLDLGAIGKGYAVDRMAELLDEWDLGPALVHGGFSSVLALEPPPGHAGWPLTMSDPGEPSRVLGRVTARQTALGASGLRKGDHIRDPRTGDPARGRIAAWASVRRPPRTDDAAIAETPRIAAAADALSTAFMLMALDEIEALCNLSPGVEAWVLAGVDAHRREWLHFGGAGPGAFTADGPEPSSSSS